MGIIEILGVAVTLIFIASLVGIAVRRLRMPYTVGLVGVGLAFAFLNPLASEFAPEEIRRLLIPEIILGLLVPPLVFEAAFHIKLDELRRHLWLILAFAVPGVVLTMLMVGGVIAWGTGLALPVAMVFGSLIAATDPIAVVALFRSLGVPKRLQTLLEGESLLNDGTAIVVFNLMLAIVATGSFSLSQSLLDFIMVAGGGLLIGLVTSTLISFVINRIDEYLIESTLTAVAAYGSYLIAEEFHLSGVLAVVAAGLVTSNIGPRGMSPTTRMALFNFWEYAAYLANSFVFLLIGLVIDLNVVLANGAAIMLAIGAVLAARAVIIYTFSRLSKEVTFRMQHVIYWGGLRGAISLALALSLPQAIIGKDLELLQAMSFGVVLFTLLVQGTTMGSLVQRLQFVQRTSSETEYERRQARAVAARAAYEHVASLNQEGLVSAHTWKLIKLPMKRRIDSHAQAVREILHLDRSLEITELNNAYNEGLRAQRSAYNNLFLNGVISEETFLHLVSEVDFALDSKSTSFTDIFLRRSQGAPPITRMITAVLDEADIEDAVVMLNIMGIPVTQLASTNSRDGAHKVTMLVGIEAGQEREVVQSLLNCCTSRPDFSTGLFDPVIPLPPSQEITIDGASIYVLDIEHYEEI